MLQQFLTILEGSKENEIIPFLQSLTDEAKRKLVTDIKKISKEYLDYKQVQTAPGTFQYKAKANEKQNHILLITSFVCCNRQEFEKTNFPSFILDQKHLRKIIDWYCPSWFSDFVNKLGDGEFLPYSLDYDWAMELTEKGFLTPSKQLVVKLLPQYIFESVNRSWTYKPENILKRPITLNEHIWYFFELESNIHYSERWLNFEKGINKDRVGWIQLFTEYTSAGKIDRARVLQEALLASNRNFNKVLSGWFSELFTTLDPSVAEIVELQQEMYSVLSSSNSKPVNTVLQYVKKIIKEKAFDAVGFLDNVPILLTSTTKNIVVSTLGILEKLAKLNKQLQLPVCKTAIQVFIHSNDELQARAAKLILTYDKQLDDEFVIALEPYHASLMTSARKLLGKYISEDVPAIHEPVTAIAEATPLQAIELPQTIDDFVFLASQAFDNNQSWHFDILPAAVLKWYPQLKNNNIAKLEPALQRALKMTRSDFRAGQGSLDHMLAIFFIDVCIHLCRKFPADSNSLIALFQKFNQGEGSNVQQWMSIGENTFYMEGWDNHYHDPFFLPHKKLLLLSLQKMKEQDQLPLLSTPTHDPAWILPETLVKRLAVYQKENKTPFNIDYQVAVSRCLLTDTTQAIILAEEQLSGESKNLLLFLFGKHKEPMGPFDNTAAWMCCSLALKEKKNYTAFEQFAYYKKPFECYTGQYSWQSLDEEYDQQSYDYQLKKNVYKKARRKILRLNIDKTSSKQSEGLKKFFGSILKKSKEDQAIIYDDFVIKAQWLSIPYDIKRLLLLTPNNPEPFLAEIVNRCLKYPVFFGEDDKRMVIACLQTLHEIWSDFGNMAHLFIGTCMISSDKTVVNIAGETWIKAVSAGKIDNSLLGKVIGLHESIEFAPLKRFTDLISQSLFRVSPLHNKSLLILIEQLLVTLPDTPIKNLKKLLEIYAELKAVNKSALSNKILDDKLNVWKQNAGLQKTIAIIFE